MSPRRSLDWLSWACILAFSLLIVTPAVFHAQQSSGYHVIRTITLGSEGTWDYITVDPDARRVYIPRQTHIMVLDEGTGKVVADIPDLKGLHGVAVAPEFNRGFATGNNPSGVIPVFDLKTFQVTSTIPSTGDDADGILYDRGSKRVFVNNGDAHNVTVVDAATAKVVGTVALPGVPEAAVADGKGNIFVNVVDKGQVLQYNAKTLAITGTWPAAPCERPYGLAIDEAHRRLFISCQGATAVMVVMNADTGKIVTSLPIGGGSDGSAFDPGTGDVFATCRDGGGGQGVVNIFHEDSPDSYSKIADVKYMYGARTVALDPKTHHIFSMGAVQNEPVAPTPQNANPRPRPVLSTFSMVEVGR